ncbi:MAG TPA: carboxypeptidase M32 [Oligoflexia bacterium]|nr:carboxypeptidase M32 [Oligoflexia bacterium]HMR24797.1 carboxypeptidase M32 [Oligoflexia bacterium]
MAKIYDKLHEHFETISAYGHALSICGWDEQVNMPAKSHTQRAKSISKLQQARHMLMTDPRVKDWIDQASQEDLNLWQQANIREIKRVWENATCLTPKLIDDQIRATSNCQQAWKQMRGENNWKDFEPLLDEVIQVSKEEAKIRADITNTTPYQALVNLYDPGQSIEQTTEIFTELKNFLPNFIQTVMGKQKNESYIHPNGTFAINDQKELCLELMKVFGFDFEYGRLDVSHHPFCGGVPSDVRITTRYKESDFVESVMGVIHETGHACYEQNLPQDWNSQPVGKALGMSMHESQSLFFEMQVARNPNTLAYLAQIFKKYLGAGQKQDVFWATDNIVKLYSRVQPDFIRVSADELTYPLHVILRFELEQEIIEGDLKTSDIPAAWDEKMQSYLGVDTKGNYKDGCMQDVHWPSGGFGYFPSYTLGAMTAAQLFHALKSEIPNIEQEFTQGKFNSVRSWLKDKVWTQASLKSKKDLLVAVTGENLTADYFINHLKQRYAGQN